VSVSFSTLGLTHSTRRPPYAPDVEAHVRTGWRDAWLPAVLLALGAVELASLGTEGWIPSVGIEALAASLLVLRRRYPVVVVPAAVLSLSAIPLTGTAMDEASSPILFIVVAIFSLGRWTSARLGTGVVVVLLLVFLALTSALDTDPMDWTDVMFIGSLGVPPFVFGRIVRQLDEQKRLLAAQQEVIREQAVQGERDRIARELHDVIAHSISAMVVQTAAAQDLLRTRPEQAAQLLRSVADTGRSALAETGRLLHLVRDEAGELGLEPAPSVRDVPNLVRSFRENGRQLDVDLDLPETPLPSGVDVSAYRVVQEALTNAMKHGDGSVRLRVVSTPECLQIQCVNAAGERSGDGSGLGLRGMAERVGLLGGTMHNARTPAGEFVLDVALPLPRTTT
jgi:signal transduction histidine kinase